MFYLHFCPSTPGKTIRKKLVSERPYKGSKPFLYRRCTLTLNFLNQRDIDGLLTPYEVFEPSLAKEEAMDYRVVWVHSISQCNLQIVNIG